MTCELCGQLKPDVRVIQNPLSINVNVCSPCERELAEYSRQLEQECFNQIKAYIQSRIDNRREEQLKINEERLK